jgi:dynactin 1
VGICELRGKLRDFSNLNKRFAAVLTRCQADEWIGYGKVLGELGGVEARVDGWIGTIRQDEFNEKDCARDLARYVSAHLCLRQELIISLTAQFKHLGSTVFDRPELDVPEQQLALAYTMDYDLDNFAAAVGFARQTVYSLTQEPGT